MTENVQKKRLKLWFERKCRKEKAKTVWFERK